ncbi:hypothetical protein [Halobellus ruber]|uniref:Uncharacterized protein n=1 Tax=Halobellus ruber TaxID=2761102 RepID=A0A7J9SE95_9EURY|nr:hypothetical protein [Halobellus ruber]MBB6644852.1 hypothetical protein [Halobellus ruber]
MSSGRPENGASDASNDGGASNANNDIGASDANNDGGDSYATACSAAIRRIASLSRSR